jgi:hypothetical protein
MTDLSVSHTVTVADELLARLAAHVPDRNDRKPPRRQRKATTARETLIDCLRVK